MEAGAAEDPKAVPLACHLALHRVGARERHQPPIEAERRKGEGRRGSDSVGGRGDRSWKAAFLGSLAQAPLNSPKCIPRSGEYSREVAGTTHQSGAKSTGARISHSSASGPVSASKEKRVDSEDGDVAVKLGGQANRAAPAGGEAGSADTLLQSNPPGRLSPRSQPPEHPKGPHPVSPAVGSTRTLHPH